METFEFVIILHLMLRVLGLTNDLSHALQQKRSKHSLRYEYDCLYEKSIAEIERWWMGASLAGRY
jgi:hypothetical protein